MRRIAIFLVKNLSKHKLRFGVSVFALTFLPFSYIIQIGPPKLERSWTHSINLVHDKLAELSLNIFFASLSLGSAIIIAHPKKTQERFLIKNSDNTSTNPIVQCNPKKLCVVFRVQVTRQRAKASNRPEIKNCLTSTRLHHRNCLSQNKRGIFHVLLIMQCVIKRARPSELSTVESIFEQI